MTKASKYENILIGVDGSKQARLAFDKAVAVAKRNDATLTIASVMNGQKFVGLGATTMGFGYVDQSILDEAKHNVEVVVEKYKKLAEAAGLTRVHTTVYYGNSKVELAKTLPVKYNIDLIMIGATGMNVVERALMGSNASYVVTNADVDVLIVKTDNSNH